VSRHLTRAYPGGILRPVGSSTPETDHLDEMLAVWAREIPDLDPLTEGIVERIQGLAKSFDRSMEETLAQYALDRRAFHLLGRLRSYGAPYQQSAGHLAEDMRLSSGAMTARLDRLEKAGLIRRLPDPNDRRGTLVEPTEAGHAAWDATVGTQAKREAMFASVLSESERQELQRLLRRLMRAFPGKSHHGERRDPERGAGTTAGGDAPKA
jgi:DNA-binding MarR family transcriptional regulator